MKRLTLVLLVAVLVVPRLAQAQGLTMQMSNGWSFTFAGNVNVFWVFSKTDSLGITPKSTNSSVRTGLLPAFATFTASGKEAGMDLGVHVGFGNQIQNAGNAHDQFGAQIDLRQVFMTIGLKGGMQILAGRELGVYQRQNILNDMTLFGVGAVGDPQGGGTTLGRIGYGYVYPNFNAQITLSSSANSQVQWSIGAFQPSRFGAFIETSIPRIEAELVWKNKTTARSTNKFMVWVGGEWQSTKNPGATDTTLSSTGVTAGVHADLSDLSIVVSAYIGKGIGHVLGFRGESVSGLGKGRPSDGGYAQVTYKMGRKTTVGVSYGVSRLKGADDGAGGDVTDAHLAELQSYTGGVYYQWTRSLKVVGEVTRERNELGGVGLFAGPNRTDVSGGFMLFF
jgi:hypothetical protein